MDKELDAEDKGKGFSDFRKTVNEAIQEVSFGEVVITIHDSRVVQIEIREKRRFN